MAQTSANLNKAKVNKNDEFYTLLTDIEKELSHYKEHFKGKVVYCNCDDPTFSNFWAYFHLQFNFLGLKKLVATFYKEDGDVYKAEYTGEDDNDVTVYTKTDLEGNGDFRSQGCLDILAEADIVVTNPPFSLFREFVATLMEYDKKFLIIGNMNAITYGEFFPLLKENKVWIGYESPTEFNTPSGIPKKFGNIMWFTNLDIKKRHERLLLWRQYDELAYSKYDNCDAINVDKVKDIPVDYEGVMGVPITYLGHHNPDQFEIVGLSTNPKFFTPTKMYINPKMYAKTGEVTNADILNMCTNLFYSNKPVGKTYYKADNVDGYLVQPYARVLIKRVLTKYFIL